MIWGYPLFVLAQATNPSAEVPVYDFDWKQWLTFYDLHFLLAGVAIFILTMLVGWMLRRMFRAALDRFHLSRTLRLATLAVAIYLMLFAWHPKLMINKYDYGSIVVHKAFAATMLFVVLRLMDWLLIVPLMTRGGKVPVPRFVHQIVLIVVYLFAILGYSSWAFGLDIDKFLAGSAVLSIVLGLALQETLGNFFSGMVMQASSPFQIGDWIECGGTEGRVIDMNWRTVTLYTNQDNYVLIPNSMVAKDRIVNYHSPTNVTMRSVKVGVDYNVPPNDVRAVLLAAAQETPGVLPKPAPGVGLSSFDDSAITYSVGFAIANPQAYGGIENQVRINIWYRLKQAGYGIPFPTRTVEMVDTERRTTREREESLGQRRELFASIPLLSHLKPEQVTRLAEVTRDVVFAAGQVICHQDDEGSNMFILRRGIVESTMRLSNGATVSVGQIAAVNIVGEYSATTGKPRPTTLTALTDIQCVELKREHLQELLNADPDVMAHMSQVVAERAAARARLMEQAGGKENAEHHAAPENSVLEGMKRLFERLHLPTLGK